MKRSTKSKRVSWAPTTNLCQVALFRKEESPCQVGFVKMHLQMKKTSRNSYLGPVQPDDLPPGFGAFSRVPSSSSIKWRCPLKFAVSLRLHIAAGEQSTEVGDQFLRQSKILESVYPRSSSIPSNPSVSPKVQSECYDDRLTPIIPILPIEEIDIIDQQREPEKISPLEPTGLVSGSPDIAAAAASAALTALLKSNVEGTMIDTNLLIKILNDPKMVEKLMKISEGNSPIPGSNPAVSLPMPNISASKLELPQAAVIPSHGSAVVNCHPAAVPVSTPISAPVSGSVPVPVPIPTYGGVSIPRIATPFPITNPMTPVFTTAAPAPAPIQEPVHRGEAMKQQFMKGMDYYKNLIRQHGAERKEHSDHVCQNQNLMNIPVSLHRQNLISGETFTRQHPQKPCIFFNSPRGCRNGSSCLFQHVALPFEWRTGNYIDEPSAKRIRLGGEILGS